MKAFYFTGQKRIKKKLMHCVSKKQICQVKWQFEIHYTGLICNVLCGQKFALIFTYEHLSGGMKCPEEKIVVLRRNISLELRYHETKCYPFYGIFIPK